jgi:hypothetical protein
MVVIDQADAHTGFGRGRRGGQPAGPGADDNQIEGLAHPATTVMPGRHRIWQVR